MTFKRLILICFLFVPNEIFGKQISGIQIISEVEEWLKKKKVEPNFSILPEIKYPDCKKIEISKISTNFNLLKISCSSPNKWSFIIRNKISSAKKDTNKKIKEVKKKKKPKHKIVVLNKRLEKGSIISVGDIKIIERRVANNNVVNNSDFIIGKKLKKSILPNKPIYFSSLQKNWMIEKNSEITIVNNIGPISIKVHGIAMENGDFEQQIKVKNASSGEIIRGFVKNKKKVQINTKQF